MTEPHLVGQQPGGTFIVDNDWEPGPASCPDCGCHIVQLFPGQTCYSCLLASNPQERYTHEVATGRAKAEGIK